MSGNPPTTVLLVGDDASDADFIQKALGRSAGKPFRVEWVRCLGDALDRLGRGGGVELILLDLGLPDGHGVGGFDRLAQAAPGALILLLCGDADDGLARLALQRGAHETLDKNHLDAHWLPRSLNYLVDRKAAHEALRDNDARFRAMSDASPLGIFVTDADGLCVYANPAYRILAGLGARQTLGTRWDVAIHPEDRSRVLAEWHDAGRRKTSFDAEFRFLRSDRSVVWTRLNTASMDDPRQPHGEVQTFEDISARKVAEFALRAAEEALFAEKERAQVTLNSIGDAVLSTDTAGRLTYMNLVAETMTGWNRDEAHGRPLAEVFRIVDGTTRAPAANPAERAIAEDRTVGLAADCVLIRRDGAESSIEDSAAPIHNRDGQVTGAVLVFHDVSESRFMALKMAHLAQHDFLTGLPNRMLLTERLSQAIGLAQRHGKQVGLLFLDLDNFKQINDSLGHAIGDQLLQSAAGRLSAGIRSTDTVCRQGGDEFVVLLAELARAEDAALVAETLRVALAEPHTIAGHELHVTLSIGISVFPDDGDNADTLMQNADTAMYHAKETGRNNYQFFRTEMNTRAVRRLFLETSMRRALKQKEFVLHYQPKIDLASTLMTGCEALLRWQDPELGLVLPGHFVPIAEESGLIVPIGRWVLREACRQMRAWLDAGLRAVPVAVNISPIEFRHKGFLEGVTEILQQTGLPPHFLELELTEGILMHDAESSSTVLAALKEMGVQLAIDDFGTGYSSLSYLKRFPIDTLKIDQSFVRDIAAGSDAATIVSAVIGMGRNLRHRVIAEGVETQEQLLFLCSQHCDEGQGFKFSHPLPADDFAQLLAAATDPPAPPLGIVGNGLPAKR